MGIVSLNTKSTSHTPSAPLPPLSRGESQRAQGKKMKEKSFEEQLEWLKKKNEELDRRDEMVARVEDLINTHIDNEFEKIQQYLDKEKPKTEVKIAAEIDNSFTRIFEAEAQWLKKRERIGVKIENKEIIERRSKMTKEKMKKLRELIKATEEYLAKLPDIEHDEKQSVYNYYSKDVGWTFLCRDISQAIHTVKEWGNHLSYRLKKAIRNQINEEITDEVYERFMNEEEGDE